MSNLAVLLSLCASTARADAPGNIYVSALQKSGGTAFGDVNEPHEGGKRIILGAWYTPDKNLNKFTSN